MNYTKEIEKTQYEIGKKFSPRKLKADYLSEVYHLIDLDSKSDAVSKCGSYLEFTVSAAEHRLTAANFCHDRLCPLCQWRRSMKIYAQTSKMIDHLSRNNLRYLFLTLTIKNCSLDSLVESVDLLISSFHRLMMRRSVKRSVLGSSRTLEITINKDDQTFHPHLHCILCVSNDYFSNHYISQSEWATMWSECCSLDYLPIVDVRTVKKGKIRPSEGLQTDFSNAIAEISKYAVKDADFLVFDDLDETISYVRPLVVALSGRRLISYTGVFKQVRHELNLDDAESGDLIHTDCDSISSEVQSLVVRYFWRFGVYVKQDE